MSSRIEQIIEEIEEYVDSCKYQPLSTTKIVVNKEEIEELLRELRLKTPDEIKRYQKIISNKDAILEDAQTKADGIIADAQAKAGSWMGRAALMRMESTASTQIITIPMAPSTILICPLALTTAIIMMTTPHRSAALNSFNVLDNVDDISSLLPAISSFRPSSYR